MCQPFDYVKNAARETNLRENPGIFGREITGFSLSDFSLFGHGRSDSPGGSTAKHCPDPRR